MRIHVLIGCFCWLIFSQSAQSQDLWPRGVNYQIFVRSFCDSDNDGIGDIKGVISKLDYLKDLGINGIWLTPINVSPSYHKYDIVNYMDIDPEYGTVADVKKLLEEAHKRGMHVLMDLVVNHTSQLNPWFIESQKGKGNPYRDYYLWSDKDQKKDPKNWWPVDKKKGEPSDTIRYYGYFGSNMPDLNYDNPKVREEIIKIGNFWVKEVGVDGFRLDAAQHIYFEDEHDKSRLWWQQFRAEMEKTNKNFFMVGEVWNVDSIVAPYLKKGLHSVFNFDLAGTIIKSLKEEKGDSLLIKYQRIMKLYKEMDPAYVDATFLSNHDQNRIITELHSDKLKAKLAAAILLTLPGTPYIYYGEEIGMNGKKPDEQIREPFLWDAEASDKMRTKWIKSVYNPEGAIVPLKSQMVDNHSVYNCYKKLIHLRNRDEILRLGNITPIPVKAREILAYSRQYKGKTVYVIHNLSSKATEVDLSLLFKGKLTADYNNGSEMLNKGKILKMNPYSSVVLK